MESYEQIKYLPDRMVGVWVKKGILERICECTTIERKEKHKESMRKSNWLDQGGKRE